MLIRKDVERGAPTTRSRAEKGESASRGEKRVAGVCSRRAHAWVQSGTCLQEHTQHYGSKTVPSLPSVVSKRFSCVAEGKEGFCTQALRPRCAQGQPDAFCFFGWRRIEDRQGPARLHSCTARTTAPPPFLPASPSRLSASYTPLPSPRRCFVFSRTHTHTHLPAPCPSSSLPTSNPPHRHGS